MDPAEIGQTDSELANLLHQFVSQIKKKQLPISENLTELFQVKSNMGIIDSEINTLLSQITDKINKNSLSISEITNLLTQFIEGKNSEINSSLSQILTSTKKNTLTAAEVSGLWHQYMGDSMAICVYKYFLKIVEDKEIKPILESALQLAENHIAKISEFLNGANFQVPIGFTENDVNLDAPRLFSDQFLLFYSYIMTIHGLTAYSLAITNSERWDIQNYFFECMVTAKELFTKNSKCG